MPILIPIGANGITTRMPMQVGARGTRACLAQMVLGEVQLMQGLLTGGSPSDHSLQAGLLLGAWVLNPNVAAGMGPLACTVVAALLPAAFLDRMVYCST